MIYDSRDFHDPDDSHRIRIDTTKKKKETNIVYFVKEGTMNQQNSRWRELSYREKKSNEIMILDRSMFKISSEESSEERRRDRRS